MRRSLSFLIALAAAAGIGAIGAQAATPPVVRLADYVDSEPLLGVDARAGAVVSWIQDAPLAGGKSDGQTKAIMAAERRAGGDFAKPRRISSAEGGVRTYALAVGARGDSAITWQPDRAGAELLVNRRSPGGHFAAPLALPGSTGGREPAAAIDARGRLLVAWLRASRRDRCGMVVMASVAPRGGPFKPARRISGSCAHAMLLRAALARGGDGAVAWRSAGARSAVSRSAIAVSAFTGGRFRAPRTASAVGNVGGTLALAAGGRRVLAVWRDHAAIGQPARNRVLASSIDGARIGAPQQLLSTPDALLRDVDAAMNVHDAAIVAWQRSDDGMSVFDASAQPETAIRPSGQTPFGAPEKIGVLFDTAEALGITGVALDGAGRALAGYDNVVTSHPPAGLWRAPRSLVHRADGGKYGGPIEVGLGDAGEGVAAWQLYSDDGNYYVRAAVIPAPR